MLNRLKEKEEKIQQVLEELREELARGVPVVVEGKNDIETLHALGIEGNIVTVKTGGKSFLDISTELEQSKVTQVILLLDFDRRGKQGTNRLRHCLEHAGIRVNLEFWRAVMHLVGRDVQCIEGLETYLTNLQTKLAAHANR